MSEIKVSGLSHVYSADTPFEKIAIDNVNVEIPHGQLVGLIGHTGSGKSTFIQHLNGLLVPSSGTVLVDSVNINRAIKQPRAMCSFNVGLVFQYPEYQLFEETVYADIAFGPKNMKLSESEIDEPRARSGGACRRWRGAFRALAAGAVRRSEAQSCHSRCYRHAPGRAHPR